MDIQFQICSLIIVALILVTYGTHKHLMLRSERIFYRALFMTTVLVILDILTIASISHIDTTPVWLAKVFSKAFASMLIMCSGTILVYLMSDILKKEKYRILNRNVLFILFIEILVTCCLPISFAGNNYAIGPAVTAVYSWLTLNFCITLAFVIRSFNKISRRKRFGIILWIIVWAILGLTEILNPQMPLLSLAVSMGVLLLFGLLEKPESKLEKQYGCFNYFALISFLEELLENKTPISVLTVSLRTVGTLTGEALFRNARHVLRVLEKHKKNIWIFRGINEEFICIAKSNEPIDDLAASLEYEAKKFPKAASYARVTRCDNMDTFSSANEIIQFLNFAKKKDNEQSVVFNISQELTDAYHYKKNLEVELRNALINNRIETFFQPIYSVKHKKITSCEALARIRKEDGDIIMPSEFIPLAEENGSILELGYTVFEQTCQFISQYCDLVDYVEVNLSVVQCEDDHMADKLIEIMDRYLISPKKINLEITETASIVTKQKLLRNMERLLEYGVTFSLDDFGKGESNLMYVVDMPISIVKLDFDMSKSYFKSAKAKCVVDAVKHMSNGLNLKLVAEGIETAEELAAMEKQNIDYIQGYYFSKPLPKDQFVSFVQKYNVR